MAALYEIRNGETTLSEPMSRSFQGAIVQLFFYDGAGVQVTPTGAVPQLQRDYGAEFRPVYPTGENEWQFNGPCTNILLSLAGVTGYSTYRAIVWRSVPTLPLADPSLMAGTTNPRLRVDVAQTGFFEGREFRTFKEWGAATTATYVIKAVVPVNIILFELGIELEAGTARIETLVGGTEGGVFAEVLPILPTNTMSEKPQPAYVNQVTLTAGGTLAGGTLLDPLRAKTSDNSTFSASVGASAGAERGVGANTYYFRATLTAVIGIFKARWEGRP